MIDSYEQLSARAAENEPQHLYKYRPASSDADIAKLIEVLVDRRVWFASPLTFNDPFDCYPSAVITGTKAERRRKLAASFTKAKIEVSRARIRQRAREVAALPVEALDDLFEQGLTDTLQGTSAFCLAGKWNSLLMWSHYAMSHTGVCVEFVRKLPGSIITSAMPVHYAEQRPSIEVIGDPSEAKVVKALYTKSNVWQYEGEWRVVLHQREGLRSIPEAAVSRVILGASMDPSRRRQVLAICFKAGIPCEQAAFHRRRWDLELQHPTWHE